MFKRRIGADPHRGGTSSTGKEGCPDIWELDSGDFAVIRIDRTPELARLLPSDASCGPRRKSLWLIATYLSARSRTCPRHTPLSKAINALGRVLKPFAKIGSGAADTNVNVMVCFTCSLYEQEMRLEYGRPPED